MKIYFKYIIIIYIHTINFQNEIKGFFAKKRAELSNFNVNILQNIL